MATARLRYRDLQLGEIVEREAVITWEEVQEPDRYFRRQAAVAEWAELLGKSFYAQCGSIEAVLGFALPPAWDQAGRQLEHFIRRSEPLFVPFCTDIEPGCWGSRTNGSHNLWRTAAHMTKPRQP